MASLLLLSMIIFSFDTVHALKGGWQKAHATFYGGEDASGTMGGLEATDREYLNIFDPNVMFSYVTAKYNIGYFRTREATDRQIGLVLRQVLMLYDSVLQKQERLSLLLVGVLLPNYIIVKGTSSFAIDLAIWIKRSTSKKQGNVLRVIILKKLKIRVALCFHERYVNQTNCIKNGHHL
ncbi:expansin/Lol pI [Artemisia annua]|uniref:Expansin/Lol pI n=1 Tax=Artemisia annua TaxID=35608 RepID=A0A2U1MET4_ARTAN|nr:expansin/Lol pI [Artemisia annua]